MRQIVRKLHRSRLRIGLEDRPRSGLCAARRNGGPALHPAHAAAAGTVASPAAAHDARISSIGTLLGSHVLRDGELVLLILKPSFWFIVFSSIYFAAVAALIGTALWAGDHYLHGHFYFELALFCIIGRVMFAVLQWMGQLYILTDRRVLRITGVFGIDIFDCALRKVVRTRIVSPGREKLVGAGSIEIIPEDESMPTGIWQTITRPAEVHERLVAAINRAKQSGSACEG